MTDLFAKTFSHVADEPVVSRSRGQPAAEGGYRLSTEVGGPVVAYSNKIQQQQPSEHGC